MEGVGRYEVAGSGRLRLRDGVEVGPGGWRWHGGDLVHGGAGLVWSVGSGVVRRARPGVVASWPVAGGEVTVSADILGLHVSAVDVAGGGRFVPLRMVPRDGAVARRDAWTGVLSRAERTMVADAGLNAMTRSDAAAEADAVWAEVLGRELAGAVPSGDELRQRRGVELAAVRGLVDRVLADPDGEDGGRALGELARAELVARVVAEQESGRGVAEVLPEGLRAAAAVLTPRQVARLAELFTLARRSSQVLAGGVPEEVVAAVRAAVLAGGRVRRRAVGRWADARAERFWAGRVGVARVSAEESAREARARVRREWREPAVAAAEWRLRHESALDVFFSDDRRRLLPPGFADVDRRTGRRRYALGHHGRLLWAGDASLTSGEMVAAAVVAALPDGQRGLLGKAVREAVRRILTRYDPRLFVQAMMEDNAPLRVVVGGRTYLVKAKLDLGDLGLAAYVPRVDGERMVPGEEWHVLVNADHEVHSFTRRAVSDGRKLGVTVGSTDWSFAGDRVQLVLSRGVAGGSGVSYGQGFDRVSALKRYFDVSGMPAFFDFGDASVRTEVSVVGSAGGCRGGW